MSVWFVEERVTQRGASHKPGPNKSSENLHLLQLHVIGGGQTWCGYTQQKPKGDHILIPPQLDNSKWDSGVCVTSIHLCELPTAMDMILMHWEVGTWIRASIRRLLSKELLTVSSLYWWVVHGQLRIRLFHVFSHLAIRFVTQFRTFKTPNHTHKTISMSLGSSKNEHSAHLSTDCWPATAHPNTGQKVRRLTNCGGSHQSQTGANPGPRRVVKVSWEYY